MFPPDVLLAYVAAVLVVVVAPGPDNILAIGRGLSQGPLAAALSSVGAGIGIMVHTLAATLGLSLVLQASPWAFWVVKGVGAAYLLWLGIKALRSRDLITFSPALRRPLHRVFITGVLSNVLNPKPGLFVLAFIPQFVSTARGLVAVQMLVYGAIFAVLTALSSPCSVPSPRACRAGWRGTQASAARSTSAPGWRSSRRACRSCCSGRAPEFPVQTTIGVVAPSMATMAPLT